MVSSGLTILEPTEAERQGYLASDIARVIVPATLPRLATSEELDGITASTDTKRTMQLVRLPRILGARLLEECNKEPLSSFDEHKPYQEIVPGIRGLYMTSRLDDANQLTVSVNLQEINQLTGLPAKVGCHIDTRENPDASLLIGNMGPGERWHQIVPEFNRDSVGGAQRSERARFMETHPDPSSMKVYWLKLAAPTEDYIEAILNAPVAYAMHDGSTLGCSEHSTALFCAIDPVNIGEYPSPLAP